MYECEFCKKECKNNNSQVQHSIRCKLNPAKIEIRSNFISYNKKIKEGLIEKKFGNQFLKAEKLGLPKPSGSKKEKSKKRVWTEEQKNKHSIAMQRAVRANPDSYNSSNVCGRVKNFEIEFNGKKIKVKGNWEKLLTEYFIRENINFETVNFGFEYKWNDELHLYFPDFYLPDTDEYIEVKGYQRDRDVCKWNAFIKKLKIIKLSEIKQIKSGTFNINNLSLWRNG